MFRYKDARFQDMRRQVKYSPLLRLKRDIYLTDGIVIIIIIVITAA